MAFEPITGRTEEECRRVAKADKRCAAEMTQATLGLAAIAIAP